MNHQEGNEIRKVLNEYLEQEKELEKKLRECENIRHKLNSTENGKSDNLFISDFQTQREISLARNRQLIKDLEKSKAILRTESTFTPNEQELYDLANSYRRFLQQ